MAETVIRCAICGLGATICDQGAQGIGYFDIREPEAIKCVKGDVMRCAGIQRAFQGSRMSLASDDPEHVIVVPGGLLAPAA